MAESQEELETQKEIVADMESTSDIYNTRIGELTAELEALKAAILQKDREKLAMTQAHIESMNSLGISQNLTQKENSSPLTNSKYHEDNQDLAEDKLEQKEKCEFLLEKSQRYEEDIEVWKAKCLELEMEVGELQ